MIEVKPQNVFTVCATIVILAVVAGTTMYSINDRKLMSTNIESAIAKGVDPLSVRCSYASGTDTICVAYAASHGSQSFNVSNIAKK